MREYHVTSEDLLGVIDLAARYSKKPPIDIIREPTSNNRRNWRRWVLTIVKRIAETPPRGRLVPRCHMLGADPQGYDWKEEESECDGCAVKLTCILSDPDLVKPGALRMKVSPLDSENAIRASIVPMRKRERIPPRRYRLVYRNRYANYSLGAVWDLYPSGFLIPKVFPHQVRPGMTEPTLYRVSVHNIEDYPVLYLEKAYRAHSAREALGARNFHELETMLEGNPGLWEDVQKISDELVKPGAVGASGDNTHTQVHIRYERELDLGHIKPSDIGRRWAGGYGWAFWNMPVVADGSVEIRHMWAKLQRREGVKFLAEQREPKPCAVCEHYAAR